jgi:hypothetical protein
MKKITHMAMVNKNRTSIITNPDLLSTFVTMDYYRAMKKNDVL